MTNLPSGPNDHSWALRNTPHIGVATCYGCGKPFAMEYDWQMRHSGDDDEDAVYHEDCCPVCHQSVTEPDAPASRPAWSAARAS